MSKVGHSVRPAGAPSVNPELAGLSNYASKAISEGARRQPGMVDLSFGEPAFGPPAHMLDLIKGEDLSFDAFFDGAKRYETARGALPLRRAIARWYERRNGLTICPETEVLVTNGGVEAITLAILATTGVGDRVGVTDPSYTLYPRAARALGREVVSVMRPPAEHEYLACLEARDALEGAKVLIVNSPENPTGYVASQGDWSQLAAALENAGAWLIHDEVYDVMPFERPHVPAAACEGLRDRSIMVNSLSKKFGIPGLRIGWMVGPARVIEAAVKAHDYLYLSVNIQSEKVALRLLEDQRAAEWFAGNTAELMGRRGAALERLNEAAGFEWTRQALGGMFLFPNVRRWQARLPESYRAGGGPIGDAVAKYWLEKLKVAVVPGSVYGSQGDEHVRLVLCSKRETFDLAIERLAGAI